MLTYLIRSIQKLSKIAILAVLDNKIEVKLIFEDINEIDYMLVEAKLM